MKKSERNQMIDAFMMFIKLLVQRSTGVYEIKNENIGEKGVDLCKYLEEIKIIKTSSSSDKSFIFKVDETGETLVREIQQVMPPYGFQELMVGEMQYSERLDPIIELMRKVANPEKIEEWNQPTDEEAEAAATNIANRMKDVENEDAAVEASK